MPLLADCWLLITVFVIPPGNSHRWRLLRVFFNPFWLVSCQAFLWLKAVGRWVYTVVVIAFNYAYVLFKFMETRLLNLVSPEELKELEGFSGDEEDDYIHNLTQGIEWCSIFEALPLNCCHIENHVHEVNGIYSTKEDRAINEPVITEPVELLMDQSIRREEDEEINIFEEEENENRVHSNVAIDKPELKTVTFNPKRDAVARNDVSDLHRGLEVQGDIDGFRQECMERTARFDGPNFEVVNELSGFLLRTDARDLGGGFEVQEKGEVDGFYQEYKERMAHFDGRNFERVNELRSILARVLGDSSFPLKFTSVVSSLAESCGGRTACTKKTVRSIEAGFETYYVGQCCLGWDALQYQYMKVQEMVASFDPSTRLAYDKLADDFQYFNTLLVRFMEDERAGGERFWNYAQRRLASTSLLVVPYLSDGKHQKAEGTRHRSTDPSTLLKIVEETIHTFWIFLKKDNKRSAQHERKWLLWDISRVEDANDIEFLSLIQRMHQDNKSSILNLQREKKPWLLKRKRKNKLEDPNRVRFLFCLIDLELVSRVLNMFTVSTQQLNWCKDKLINMQTEGGRIKRRCSDHLFPSS